LKANIKVLHTNFRFIVASPLQSAASYSRVTHPLNAPGCHHENVIKTMNSLLLTCQCIINYS